MSRRLTVTLCFDAHAPDGRVWAVRVGRTWHRVAHVDCAARLTTVYKGRHARQPRAYLHGHATTVQIDAHGATIR